MIGRTSRGMPDQLCFRSSSVTTHTHRINTPFNPLSSDLRAFLSSADNSSEAVLPRSVLGLASSCLNLSSRLFSLTVMGGAPDAFWSEMRATSGMMGRAGRVCCLRSAALTVEGQNKAEISGVQQMITRLVFLNT